jgi:general secretion pathway protein C
MGRRAVKSVALVALGVSAWLHARGVAALVGADLAAPQVRPSWQVWEERQAQAATAAAGPTRSADAILARNPFDSETGPLVPAGAEASAAAPAADALPICDGVRVASIVASDDPEWSFVMLELRGERGPVLRRRGAEVVAIGVDRVVVEEAGKRCVARIFPGPRPPELAASTPAKGVARGPRGEFIVDRGTRDAWIEGATGMMHAVGVRPEKNGDEVVGLRITKLAPGTPLESLGVRAGDVLASLDGIPLTSPDRLLAAYARLPTAERLRLVIVRDGRAQQLDFEVR